MDVGCEFNVEILRNSIAYRVLTDDILYETVGISDRIDLIVVAAV